MRIQSVDRAVALLNALNASKGEIGVTELSRRLGLHVSTVHRLLASLAHGGLVEQDPRSRKYRLGIRLVEFGNTILNTRKLPQVALPYLRYLADELKEVSYLAVRDGAEMVNVLQIPGPHESRPPTWLGRGPLHCTSSGKIFLAHLPDDELESLLARGLARLTPSTISDPVALRHELRQVREQGFATSWEEHEQGTNAIAVPLSGSEFTVLAALSVVGPSYRFTPEKAMSCRSIMKGVSTQISRRLGSSWFDAFDFLE